MLKKLKDTFRNAKYAVKLCMARKPADKAYLMMLRKIEDEMRDMSNVYIEGAQEYEKIAIESIKDFAKAYREGKHEEAKGLLDVAKQTLNSAKRNRKSASRLESTTLI